MRLSLTLSLLLSFCLSGPVYGQLHTISGKVTNARLEPLAFATVQVKGYKTGITTREDGHYTMRLEDGKYELLISMIGYQPQVINIIVDGRDQVNNILLQTDGSSLAEVVVSKKMKDRAEEIIRQVIRHKEEIRSAAGAYSCNVYIKAIQEDSVVAKKKRRQKIADTAIAADPDADIKRMAMAEIILDLDYESDRRIHEERTGVTKRGNVNSLFYLSTTEGNFDLYNNLLSLPGLTAVPILSPVSYSGLLAYRFKTLKTEKVGNHKHYTIAVIPRKLSNATITGELVISDSGWVLLETQFSLPSYHLPEYDFFEVQQHYGFIDSTAWMITRQEFNYYSSIKKGKLSGTTIAHYRNFELQKTFDKKYFGTEVSATAQQAYEQDSSFWEQQRSEPLTAKEIRFIRYKDSAYRATHTKAYLDSLDHVINKTNWKKILFLGQELSYHEKNSRWLLPSVLSTIQPLSFGGTRIRLSAWHSKIYRSRKNLVIFAEASYGLRNRDVNGSFNISRMYNPFNRGFYSITASRGFQFIFQGDAWINMIKRSNIYLDNKVGLGHGLELLNGLYLYTDYEMAFRRSVADYKTNDHVDSLFGDILTDNEAVAFEPYNAVYGQVKLAYTPNQRYIREPREKIILGSAWPTFYTLWRKGIPGIMNSKVDFDYLEFGMEQELKLGLLGITNYSLKTGSFFNTKDLRLVDYKFQRRGDPLLFMNPQESFQSLDSTFPVFKRFYQGHMLHQFNGALLNKIPFLKKLELREIAGAGFLYAPERKLTYGEIFTGIERVFKWPFNQRQKFKIGVYVVGSASNSFHNPVQFKIGITTWDLKNNKWY